MKKNELNNLCNDIIHFLNKSVSESGEFPGRSFYGETFTALSMIRWDKNKYDTTINNLLGYYLIKDKSDDNFHWEFNNYALYKIYESGFYKSVEKILFPLKFKGTKCTNWTLLRNITKYKNGEKEALKEIDDKIDKYQIQNGLIKDDDDVNSFQYHCFMAALLNEVYDMTKIEKYKVRFIKSVEFISKLMLRNGCSIYIGRGQEQLFGYGPLIYIYEVAYKMTKDIKYKIYQDKAFKYLIKFKNDKCVLPLVLNKVEEGFPNIVDIDDERYLGWYAYNNYYDYLPFLLYFLVESYNICEDINISSIDEKLYFKSYNDNMYVVSNEHKYSAVIAKGGGYWTNDMAIPIISYDNEIITPCYGGEQFGSKIYKREDIPLPYAESTNIKIGIKRILKNKIKSLLKKNFKDVYYFRDELDYNLIKEDINKYKMIGENKSIIHSRYFNFEIDKILIEDIFIFKKNIKMKKFIPLNLLFYKIKKIDGNNYKIHPKAILTIEDIDIIGDMNISENSYCALGKLSKISFEVKENKFYKDDSFKFKYSINLI